jgi:sulfhydrogenase subunit beta (sulfur reductase)
VSRDERAVIAPEAVDALIHALASRGFTVVGPTIRDGAIVLDEIAGRDDLPVGWTDVQDAGEYRLERRSDEALFGYAVGPESARGLLTPRRETLVSITRRQDGAMAVAAVEPEAPRRAIIGLRGCDLAAIAVQDRVLRDGAVPDPGYTARREAMFVVAVTCSDPVATCFCASMGTGPGVGAGTEGGAGAGYDLALTELLDHGRHRLLVEVGSPRGADVLADLPAEQAGEADHDEARAVVDRSRARMVRTLDPVGARDALAAALDHVRWDDVASRCLSCTNCTLVCPTCFCSAVEERTSLDGAQAERSRRWDSCFSLDHSWLHGAGPVRGDIRSRYRQWLTHKLSTWWDQFDTSGCVGCGRCITWCPARIDLTAEVRAMSPEAV